MLEEEKEGEKKNSNNGSKYILASYKSGMKQFYELYGRKHVFNFP